MRLRCCARRPISRAYRPEPVVARLLAADRIGSRRRCFSVRRQAAGVADAEDLAIFANQLAALGVPARVAVGSVPEKPGHNLQFDLAPRLADADLRPGDSLALLAADRLTDDALVRLRRLADGTERHGARLRLLRAARRPPSACGRELSYVFGREPELIDVSRARPRTAAGQAPVFGVPRAAARPWQPAAKAAADPPRGPRPQGPAAGRRRSLALAPHRRFRADGRHEQPKASRNGSPPMVATFPSSTTARCLPLDLAARADVGVFFSGIRRQLPAADARGEPARCRGAAPRRQSGPPARQRERRLHRRPRASSGSTGSCAARSCPTSAGSSEHVRAQPGRRRGLGRAGADGGLASRRRPRRRRAGRAAGRGARRTSSSCRQTASGLAMPSAARWSPARSRRAGRAPVFAAYPELHVAGQIPRLRRDAADRPVACSTPRATSTTSPTTCASARLTAGARTLVFDGGYVFQLGLPHRDGRRGRRHLDPPRPVAGRPGQFGRARPREGLRAGHRAERGLRGAEPALFPRRPPAPRRPGRAGGEPAARSRGAASAPASPSGTGGASTGWRSRSSAAGWRRTAARRSRRSAASSSGAPTRCIWWSPGRTRRSSPAGSAGATPASCAPSTRRSSPQPRISPSPPPATIPSTRCSTTGSRRSSCRRPARFMDDQTRSRPRRLRPGPRGDGGAARAHEARAADRAASRRRRGGGVARPAGRRPSCRRPGTGAGRAA